MSAHRPQNAAASWCPAWHSAPIAGAKVYWLNKDDPNFSLQRATMNRGEDAHTDGLFTLGEQAHKEIVKLFLAAREEMEKKRINELKFTRYNQYESLVQPLVKWLRDHRVVFNYGVEVTDVDFNITPGRKQAQRRFFDDVATRGYNSPS